MENNLVQTLWDSNLTALMQVIVIPFIFIFVLRRISHSCKQLIANRYGVSGQVVFGGLGVFIHELSHLIMALIFGHRITKFKLLQFPTTDDNQLGYVNHTYNNKNGYQRFGNLLIGIAPVFGCAAVLILVTHLLEPALIDSLSELPNWQFPTGILSVDSIWKLIVLMLVASSISIGGFDLSSADLSTIWFGMLALVAIVIVTASFASLLGVAPAYLSWLHNVSAVFNGVMFFSIVITLISNGIIRLITNY